MTTLDFIPQPKQIHFGQGHYVPPSTGKIGVAGGFLRPAALRVKQLLGLAAITVALPDVKDAVVFRISSSLKPGGYRLTIAKRGVVIEAADLPASGSAVATLEQVVRQTGPKRLPCLEIEDWPDFAERGLYYDVCRGRVPKLERLLELADQLAGYKINQLQLYIEHTFKFRRHPDIGQGADPLTANDIMTLDAFCRERGIELVPSLASFGHMMNVLTIPRYRHLAEDLGIGKFQDPDAFAKHGGLQSLKGWTLSPVVPEVYVFLDELFAEFLPCFSSPRFNVCCDETWDLGLGQSYATVKKIGKGRVYLDHLVKLNELAGKYGKKIQFWGDIIHHHPELIPEIPKDVTVLEWGYNAKMDFDRVQEFTRTGLASYVCPSVSGHGTWFPRQPESRANIIGQARAGLKHGARGLLNTDWGDGGHQNFMEVSWPGYLFGAEQAWNTQADPASFSRRFCKLFLGIADRQLAAALDHLGDISQLEPRGFYQSVFVPIFFAKPGDKPLQLAATEASTSANNAITIKTVSLDAALGRTLLDELAALRKALTRWNGKAGVDPLRVLPYWIFAADAMAHAARKLTVLGPGGTDTPAGRKTLKREMQALRGRFEKLWLARNRRSEIRITLNKFDAALKALN